MRLLGNILYVAMECWLHRYIHFLDIPSDIYLDLSASLNIIFINKSLELAVQEPLIHWFSCFLFMSHIRKPKKFPAKSND